MPSQYKKYREELEKIIEKSGIVINGGESWDPQIKNLGTYKRILSQGPLGLGESYVDGWWDVKRLDEFFYGLLTANLEINSESSFFNFLNLLKYKVTNPQSLRKAFNIGKKHYNLGNDLFYYMLDNRMIYSCGYWKDANNLNEAQELKLELSCKKLNLEEGMKVLDIGCGFGGFLKYAAENYRINGIGITVSEEQKKLADKLCKGLPIEIRLQDYRTINGKFDRIVSIGMFEHVGLKNYRTYMKKIHELLEDEGLFLLQTIGKNKPGPINAWINRYIFPDAHIPTINEISKSFEGLFVMEDWHNFGTDYDKTLIAWNENFQDNWGKLEKNYDERFKRVWEYYLLSSAGAFRAREFQLWQIVLSKGGVPEGYKSIR